MTEEFHFLATAPASAEPYLQSELEALGASQVKPSRQGAWFQASLATAYRICLWSRLCNRVILRLQEFEAPTPEALYDGVRLVRWQDHLNTDDTFAVSASLHNSSMQHTHYAALKAKDAVADQFMDELGLRPSVQVEEPSLQLHVAVSHDAAWVGIDLSGTSLHQRGYRRHTTLAPLKENLAALMLYRAKWPALALEGASLLDPLCGSGTIPIEAALMAYDQAPGLHRSYFGFLKWRQHDAAIWQTLKSEAEERRDAARTRNVCIIGSDHDDSAIHFARQNLLRAGLQGKVQFETRDVLDARPPSDAGVGLIVTNPPYGERLDDTPNLFRFYADFGNALKQHFKGWTAHVLTSHPDLGKAMRLYAPKRNLVYNGPIKCLLLEIPIAPERPALPQETEGEQSPAPREPQAPVRHSAQAMMFANRLRKNFQRLQRWSKRQGVSCYRVYDADLPEYAAAIDIYENLVHVQEYAPPRTIDPKKAMNRLSELLFVVYDVLNKAPKQVFLKQRQRQRGDAQYEKLDTQRDFHVVHEGGHRFFVNLRDYLDTGLFLDHRMTRARIQELARGRDFLNLFCYTGTASVYAARGGARTTTSVDLSRTYLEWAENNLAENEIELGDHHRLIQADCMTWLEEEQRRRQRYGLIFLDPPTFSNSKRMDDVLDLQRDHVQLIRNAANLLVRGGILLFSTNSRRFKLNVEALYPLDIQDITDKTMPEDFKRDQRIHRCWLIRHRAQ